MFDIHSDIQFAYSNVNMKAANVEEEAASAVALVDT